MEKDGKGKEYESGDLVFEGEYLNGRRWIGKGKENKWKNELIFKGEYLYGERKSKNSNKIL